MIKQMSETVANKITSRLDQYAAGDMVCPSIIDLASYINTIFPNYNANVVKKGTRHLLNVFDVVHGQAFKPILTHHSTTRGGNASVVSWIMYQISHGLGGIDPKYTTMVHSVDKRKVQ